MRQTINEIKENWVYYTKPKQSAKKFWLRKLLNNKHTDINKHQKLSEKINCPLKGSVQKKIKKIDFFL